MPTAARSLTAVLLCGAVLHVVPRAFAQQYAVPAGEAIRLDGGAAMGSGGPIYGQPISGGATGGVHAGSQLHTAYRTASAGGYSLDGPAADGYPVGGEIVAESYPQVRSTQYPSGPGMGGGGYVFDEPSYAGPVVEDSVCADGCCPGGGVVYDSGLAGGYGYGGGLHDSVCGSCGTVGCTPATCDPTCEGDLACGGPVVCNKFGRCGKFYNTAVERSRCGLSAGYAFLFLTPHQGDATAAIVRNPVSGGSFNTRHEFSYDLDAGSRIFVELIRPDSIGFRVTWSGLEADTDPLRIDGTSLGVTSAALPADFSFTTNEPSGRLLTGPGGTLVADGEVQFSAFDVEATRRLRAGCWLLNTGGGIRFARLEQDYAARVIGTNAGSAFSTTAFDGAGPTGYAEARRPIGNTGLAFLTAARVSLLAGDNDHRARVTQFGVTNSGATSKTDFVPVGELQVGGEWSAWVNPNTLFFTQLAYEGQLWGGVGGPGSHDGNVGFTGFNLSVGLEW